MLTRSVAVLKSKLFLLYNSIVTSWFRYGMSFVYSGSNYRVGIPTTLLGFHGRKAWLKTTRKPTKAARCPLRLRRPRVITSVTAVPTWYLLKCEFDELAIVRFDHALGRFHHGLNSLLNTSESAHRAFAWFRFWQLGQPLDSGWICVADRHHYRK